MYVVGETTQIWANEVLLCNMYVSSYQVILHIIMWQLSCKTFHIYTLLRLNNISVMPCRILTNTTRGLIFNTKYLKKL